MHLHNRMRKPLLRPFFTLHHQRRQGTSPDAARVEPNRVLVLTEAPLGVVAVDDGVAMGFLEALLEVVPYVGPLLAVAAFDGDDGVAVCVGVLFLDRFESFALFLFVFFFFFGCFFIAAGLLVVAAIRLSAAFATQHFTRIDQGAHVHDGPGVLQFGLDARDEAGVDNEHV